IVSVPGGRSSLMMYMTCSEDDEQCWRALTHPCFTPAHSRRVSGFECTLQDIHQELKTGFSQHGASRRMLMEKSEDHKMKIQQLQEVFLSKSLENIMQSKTENEIVAQDIMNEHKRILQETQLYKEQMPTLTNLSWKIIIRCYVLRIGDFKLIGIEKSIAPVTKK
ncbi:hypothetical protein SK128_011636, partial [Halocaridina rubra]